MTGRSFPHATAESDPTLQALQERIEEQRQRLFGVMGIVSVCAAAHPNDVAVDEPDYRRAMQAVYAVLDDIADKLSELPLGARDAAEVHS